MSVGIFKIVYLGIQVDRRKTGLSKGYRMFGWKQPKIQIGWSNESSIISRIRRQNHLTCQFTPHECLFPYWFQMVFIRLCDFGPALGLSFALEFFTPSGLLKPAQKACRNGTKTIFWLFMEHACAICALGLGSFCEDRFSHNSGHTCDFLSR